MEQPDTAAVIQEKWPDRYQTMPMSNAMVALYRTARVYRDNTTLIDPPTGRTWPTLGDRELQV